MKLQKKIKIAYNEAGKEKSHFALQLFLHLEFHSEIKQKTQGEP